MKEDFWKMVEHNGPAPADAQDVLVLDANGDGRDDFAVIQESENGIRVEVLSLASDGSTSYRQVPHLDLYGHHVDGAVGKVFVVAGEIGEDGLREFGHVAGPSRITRGAAPVPYVMEEL